MASMSLVRKEISVMADENGPRRPVTLSEVARRAHVSTSVVSKVVNARPGVSAETRARAQEVLHELSYTAQRNVASRSRLVDVVVPDLHSSWMNQLMTGMHAAARESGVALVVTVESSQAWMSGAAARGTSGVIRRSEEHTPELQSRGHFVCRLLLEK